VPYLIIIGDNETDNQNVTVRKRNGENIGPFTIDEFVVIIEEEINKKK